MKLRTYKLDHGPKDKFLIGDQQGIEHFLREKFTNTQFFTCKSFGMEFYIFGHKLCPKKELIHSPVSMIFFVILVSKFVHIT